MKRSTSVEPRRDKFCVRLSWRDGAAVVEAARRRGISPTEWVTRLVLAALARERQSRPAAAWTDPTDVDGDVLP